MHLLPIDLAHLILLVLHVVYQNFLVSAHVLNNEVVWSVRKISSRRISIRRSGSRLTWLLWCCVCLGSPFWLVEQFWRATPSGSPLAHQVGSAFWVARCSCWQLTIAGRFVEDYLIFRWWVWRQNRTTSSMIELLNFFSNSSASHKSFFLRITIVFLLWGGRPSPCVGLVLALNVALLQDVLPWNSIQIVRCSARLIDCVWAHRHLLLIGDGDRRNTRCGLCARTNRSLVHIGLLWYLWSAANQIGDTNWSCGVHLLLKHAWVHLLVVSSTTALRPVNVLLATLNAAQSIVAWGWCFCSSAMAGANFWPSQSWLRKLVALTSRNSLRLVKSVLGYQGYGAFRLLANSDLLAATAALVCRAWVDEAFVAVFIASHTYDKGEQAAILQVGNSAKIEIGVSDKNLKCPDVSSYFSIYQYNKRLSLPWLV